MPAPTSLRLILSWLALSAVLGSAAPCAGHLPLSEQEIAVDDKLAENPGDVAMLLQRAELFRERGEWDQAIAKTLQAREHGADINRIDLDLANLLRLAGLTSSAEVLVESVLQRSPGNTSALLARARIHDAVDAPTEAADDYFAAVSGSDAPQPGIVTLAMERLVSVGRTADALLLADEAQKKIGCVVTIVLPAVALERKAGHPDRALVRLDELLQQSPNHPLWLAERAEVLDEMDRPEEATQVRAKVVTLLAARPAGRKTAELRALEQTLTRSEDDSAAATPEGANQGSRP